MSLKPVFTRGTIAKSTCLVMGIIFVIVALWGYIDGDNVLIFHVNAVHNTVHLLSGIVAIACAFAGEHASRLFAWIFGVVYGLVAVLGFAGVTAVEDLLHLNPADNWLHAAITLVFLSAAAASQTIASPNHHQRLSSPTTHTPQRH